MSKADNPRPRNPDLVDPFEAAARRGIQCWSEFGWGAGLAPRQFRDKDPADGGQYQATVSGRSRAGAPGGRRVH